MSKSKFIIEQPSKYDFDKTVDLLVREAELNDERIMSVMMPCRISVYLKDDGKTYTALVNGAEMSAGMPEKIAKVMKAASDETLEIVKTVTGNPI
jgi:uncharacterized protein (DUF302 family)